ncbi:MAG: M50 family metallopeptidase [Candidatus Nanohaloarchaea archaeon]
MEVFWPRVAFLVALVLGVSYVLFRDWDNINRSSILFFRRTQRGVKLIDRITSISPRGWNIYGWLAVFAGFLSIPFISSQMVYFFQQAVSSGGGGAANGPSLILPGLVSQNQFNPGASFIPVEYWVVSIAIIMVVHEFSHGIVARSQGFEINSVGWFILGILPGAFVEPKGEKMLPGSEDVEEDPDSHGPWDQGNWVSRLKVLGAGSFANYLTAAVFLLLAVGATSAITVPGDVYYVASNGTGAYEAGMRNGTLYEINGTDIESVQDVMKISGGLEPGETVSIWSSEGNFTVTAQQAPEKTGYFNQMAELLGMGDGDDTRAMIGIGVGQTQNLKGGLADYRESLLWLLSMLHTVAILNIGIGMFNMLPARPLDGGEMVSTVVERLTGESEAAESVVNYWSLGVWIVVLLVLLMSLGVI